MLLSPFKSYPIISLLADTYYMRTTALHRETYSLTCSVAFKRLYYTDRYESKANRNQQGT